MASIVWLLTSTLLVFAAALPAAAQVEASSPRRPVVPDAGEEVRVVQRGARGAVHGYFVGATPDEILLRSIPGEGPIRIPRVEVTGMSVQRGERSRAWAGALIGLGVGVVGGVILGQSGDAFDDTATAVGASVGVALPVGLLIGWLVRSPEWDGVDMAALGGGEGRDRSR